MVQISPQRVSRRHFMKSATALAITPSLIGTERSFAQGLKRNTLLAYVGTYTGAVGGGSNGEGIYSLEMNVATGKLSLPRLVAKTPNPSWIAIHPSGKYLYAVNEVGDFQGNSGSVSAFAIDTGSGNLRALNTVSSEGAGPAYLSIDTAGKFAFVANYSGGSIAVLPIRNDGSLGPAVDVHHDSGSIGSAEAANASPGSFAVSGHDAPHAHMILPDPQGRFVLATDLCQDRIYIYRFDAGTGKLTPSDGEPFIALPSGDGPRHFVFHPDGKRLYSIQEESSTLAFFRYDPSAGTLRLQQSISALPPGFAGSSFASEILISANGRFLYAANRLHDTIAVFSLDATGRLRYSGETSTLGDYPGQCKFDPTGNFLYVCNRRSDNITSFKINQDNGLLTFTGHYTPVGSPGSITFLQTAE